MKNKATRNNMRGFSLMEMLVTVLILVILFALAMIPISKIQKNLRQTELDSRAEMIFSAAILSGLTNLFAEKLMLLEGKTLADGGSIEVQK